MTALRNQVALHTVHAHNEVRIEDRRAVLVALNTAERTGSSAICFNYVAERALRRSMGIHEDAFLTLSQLRTTRELAAPFINRRLVVIARKAAAMSQHAMNATKH